jgi:hypothetical protein
LANAPKKAQKYAKMSRKKRQNASKPACFYGKFAIEL